MLPPTKLKCHICILNIVLSTVETSWFDMLLYRKMLVTFLTGGKKKDWKSLTLSHMASMMQNASKKPRNPFMFAYEELLQKKPPSIILGLGCIP